jgi:hypothetical protein
VSLRENKILKKFFLWNSAKSGKKTQISLFRSKNGLSDFPVIQHSTKSENIPWNSALEIRFLVYHPLISIDFNTINAFILKII